MVDEMIDKLLYQMVLIDKGIDILSPMINDNRIKEVEDTLLKIDEIVNKEHSYLLKEYLVHLHCVETNTVHNNVGESHRTLPYGLYMKYHQDSKELKTLISSISNGADRWYRISNKQFKKASYFNYWFIGKYYEVLFDIIDKKYINKKLFDLVNKKIWILMFSYIYNKGESKSLVYALQTYIFMEKKEENIIIDGIIGDQSSRLFIQHLSDGDDISMQTVEVIAKYIFDYGYKKHVNKDLFALNKHGWKNRLNNAIGIIKIKWFKKG